MKKIMATLAIASLAICSSLAQETIELFNGNDLSNWKFHLKDSTAKPEDVFSVKNGIIHIKGAPFGYMYTDGKYENFRLYVEWCYPIQKSNSGIFVFVQDPPAIWPNAIETQLCDKKVGDFVLLGGSDISEYKQPEGQPRPNFPVVKSLSPIEERPAGEWNNAVIICENGNITVYINGTLANKGTGSMHKDGHIALQSEGADILFRNVKLTPIK